MFYCVDIERDEIMNKRFNPQLSRTVTHYVQHLAPPYPYGFTPLRLQQFPSKNESSAPAAFTHYLLHQPHAHLYEGKTGGEHTGYGATSAMYTVPWPHCGSIWQQLSVTLGYAPKLSSQTQL